MVADSPRVASERASEHFSWAEVACQHCGATPAENVVASAQLVQLLRALEAIRAEIGKPLRVNSWYRCTRHPIEAAKKDGPGAHATGLATDLQVAGEDAVVAVRTALGIIGDVAGIGIRQHGPHGARIIHIDNAPAVLPHRPRPYIWSYP